MKIIYMGTPDFAVAPLAALAENGYEVEAVITQPDKPKGRGKTMMPTPVKEEALKHGIPVLQPVKVRDPEFVEELKNLAPDIIIVAAFGQIIPKSILDMPRFGCINIHASLLPKYRGAAPIQQAVIDGEKESGVTIMQMGTGLDTGDMISRIVVPLAKDETGGSLFDKLAQAGAELLVQTLPSIFDGTATREKQPEESPTPYAAMISKKMGLLDFSKNAEELEQEGFDAILWEQPDEKRREALKLLIKKTGIPVITTGNIYEGFAGVELDLEKAGYDCARLLIGEGRKNPVFMGNYNPWFRQAHGFRRAYEEAGIKLNDKLFLKHQNMDALKNILELGVPVDAVFNHPNQLRNEVFNLMKEMDIDIEKQCRLICNSLAASVNPDFQGYVYCIDFEQVAEKAVRMLQTGLTKGKLQPVHERVDLKITKQIKERNLQ